MHSEGGYKGSGSGSGGRVNQLPVSKRAMENNQSGSGAAQGPGYQTSKVETQLLFFFIQQTQIDLWSRCSEKSNKLCMIHVSSFLQQGAATPRPEEELDRLTKKLVYDMNHPPAEDYFGISCY